MQNQVRPSIIVIIIALIVLGISQFDVERAFAQGPQPRAPRANLGTAFTYQGQLKDNSAAANGAFDFQFALYDAASGGAQIGATINANDVNVSNGYFTVSLDFGASAFTGDARFLEIRVRPGASSGAYTTLSPRQTISPAPYALALPGLYTQQNVVSPNIIGGYSGNVVTSTLVGVTISGGGNSSQPNRGWDNYVTIGGGLGNTASNIYATIGGGVANTASNWAATIAGGESNIASGGNATIAGGASNKAFNDYATVGGGDTNTASASFTTIAGGSTNSASADYSAIGGGSHNVVTGTYAMISGGAYNSATASSATIGGGRYNIASGAGAFIGGGGFDGATQPGNKAHAPASTISGGSNNIITTTASYGTIGGGYGNVANGTYATVSGGRLGLATHYGEMAYASGAFANAGDAQTSTYVVRNTTSNNTPTELFLDGSAARITIATNRVLTFDILVVGVNTTNGNSGGYRLAGVIKNIAGTTSFVGTPNQTILGEDTASWDATVVADNTNDALVIQVTGAAGANIRWVATVRTVEVSN
jgi:hypothetical protein